ncbi:ABC transporter permease [Bacillus canaveralius]|uniref:ABC transporter permease n=1 Tax=Bacillus canaveralius TaxID=1403243 RepID=A0A2N5GPI5_9BACI|nr:MULTISPECIES: ABC transporter permease [Bacillus]PLR84619.1 ABC transporter permease [Bacillus canaveralius]PLR87352.1 ABC transporter permease [Bacillus sp. V33-4]PLS00771.1 ABC transporter permease [Bacillus canaveralius]RSK53301.1 ABC transporter permease [Bacillus canaveralius]
MFTAIFGSIESGAIYAIMALGVYLSFRILDFPDLTVDGSFVTGASVAAVLVVSGTNPFLATAAAILAGFLAGCITGLLHTKGRINALLSGILMMIALYSINLRIMGKSNVPLLAESTVITAIRDFWKSLGIDDGMQTLLNSAGLSAFVPNTWGILIVMIVLALIVKLGIDLFLRTDLGLAIRATGNNEMMIRSFSANTDYLKVLGLGLSNALVAFSGALVAQYSGYSDVGMGIGMIIVGLASVIIGEAVFGAKNIVRATLAVIGGAILYRIIVTIALRVEFLDTGDMKLITAFIVVCALVFPRLIENQKEKQRRRQRIKSRKAEFNVVEKGGEHVAAAKSDI